jgi:hypothetical protein
MGNATSSFSQKTSENGSLALEPFQSQNLKPKVKTANFDETGTETRLIMGM